MDEKEPNSRKAKNGYSPGVFDLWAFGITITIGGQYFAWNQGLLSGFGTYFIETIVMASAYICLVCTISEITSTVPFAGGVYSLTRCTIGMYQGFVAGSCEVLESIIYTATSAVAFSEFFREIFHLNASYWNLILCFGFYALACAMHLTGGRVFWSINALLAMISIGVILVYSFGSLQYIDFLKYASFENEDGGNNPHDIDNWFRDPARSFFRCLPLTSWFYIGIECLVFTSDIVENPMRTIPRAMILCMGTLLVTSLLVLFCCASTSPGITIVQSESSPLSFGLSRIFQMARLKTQIFSLPAMFATGFGFIYGYGKVLASMSKSNLFPKYFLSYETESGKVPYGGILVGSYIGYMICVLAYYVRSLESYMFDICAVFGFANYITQCYGYYIIKTQFGHLTKEFYSPFNIYGAIYASIVFLIAIAGVIGFTPHRIETLASVSFILILLSTYYWICAHRCQEFNSDELRLTFKAFIVKHNQRSAQQLRAGKGTKISPLISFSSPRIASGKAQGLSMFSPRLFGENRIGISPMQEKSTSNRVARSKVASGRSDSKSSIMMPKIDEEAHVRAGRQQSMRWPQGTHI